MPEIHPAYAAHFSSEFYDRDDLESAPFGSDEGADLLHEIESGAKSLEGRSTLEALVPQEEIDAAFLAADDNDIDGLVNVYASGFALLRYNGHLGVADRECLRRALTLLAEREGFEEIATVVLPDFDSFSSAV